MKDRKEDYMEETDGRKEKKNRRKVRKKKAIVRERMDKESQNGQNDSMKRMGKYEGGMPINSLNVVLVDV